MGGGWWFYGGVFFCRGIGAFSLCFIGGRQVPLRRGLGRGPSGSQSCVLQTSCFCIICMPREEYIVSVSKRPTGSPVPTPLDLQGKSYNPSWLNRQSMRNWENLLVNRNCGVGE